MRALLLDHHDAPLMESERHSPGVVDAGLFMAAVIAATVQTERGFKTSPARTPERARNGSRGRSPGRDGSRGLFSDGVPVPRNTSTPSQFTSGLRDYNYGYTYYVLQWRTETHSMLTSLNLRLSSLNLKRKLRSCGICICNWIQSAKN